ncbi:MAG: DUF4129 domain-containing protein [Chloroflexota bacterium]|nr:DUF4129 domain-containing protein [Chloroflexota bacterium]
MRSSWLASAGTVTLHSVVEGAWITVAYAAVQAAILGQPLQLTVPHFAAAAALGTVLARRGARRPVVWVGAAMGAGIVGFVAEPTALAAIASRNPLDALAAHAGGLLAGVAVVRGSRYASARDDESELSNLLDRGLPALAVPWLLAAALTTGATRTAFDTGAFIGTVLFAGLGFVALGMARLRSMGIEPRLGGGGRAWLTVVLAAPIAVLLIAVPIAAWLRISPDSVFDYVLQPLSSALVILTTLVALPFAVALEGLVWFLRALGVDGSGPTMAGGAGSSTSTPEILRIPALAADPAAFESLARTGLLLVGGVVLLVLLVLWARTRTAGADQPGPTIPEERGIVLPPVAPWRRARKPVSPTPARHHPTDAVQAYLATLSELDRHVELARRPAETPAGHVTRLAELQVVSPILRRLAADYQLARYAGVPITARENARAVRRWENMRGSLRRRS